MQSWLRIIGELQHKCSKSVCQALCYFLHAWNTWTRWNHVDRSFRDCCNWRRERDTLVLWRQLLRLYLHTQVKQRWYPLFNIIRGYAWNMCSIPASVWIVHLTIKICVNVIVKPGIKLLLWTIARNNSMTSTLQSVDSNHNFMWMIIHHFGVFRGLFPIALLMETLTSYDTWLRCIGNWSLIAFRKRYGGY